MKYEVYWRGYKNGKHVNELINTFDTLEEAEKSIHDWWHQNDFKPPYVIVTQHEDGFTWDYGSHTCFYDIIVGVGYTYTPDIKFVKRS